jgi:hypothetical protein
VPRDQKEEGKDESSIIQNVIYLGFIERSMS